MNPAVYATHASDENRTEATRIQLDAQGNVTNPLNPWGNAWHRDAIRAAQDSRAFHVYANAMSFLDSVIGEHRDSSTVNAFNSASARIKSVDQAGKLLEKLQVAALNGSEAALIGIVATSIYLNRLAFVDFSWYVPQEEVIVTDIRLAHDMPLPSYTNLQPAAPRTITDQQGRTLTQTASGWQAESSSKPGKFHETSFDGSKCSCLGSYWHGHCWHRTAVKAHNAPRKPVSRQRRPRRNRFDRMFK